MISRVLVAALAAAGVNRASIGVQDFDADVQRAINRLQPFQVVERVVEPIPGEQWLRDHPLAHDERRRPTFFLVRARKH